MSNRDELSREVEALGERFSRLSAGRVMTCDALIRRLWNSPDKDDSERARTFVKQLRRKLGDGPAGLDPERAGRRLPHARAGRGVISCVRARSHAPRGRQALSSRPGLMAPGGRVHPVGRRPAADRDSPGYEGVVTNPLAF